MHVAPISRRSFSLISAKVGAIAAFGGPLAGTLGCGNTQPATRDDPLSEGTKSTHGDLLPPAAHLPPPISNQTRLARQKAAQARLVELGWDALVATASTDLTYFTGVRWGLSERLFAWVLPAHGQPIWIVPSFERRRAEEQVLAGGDASPEVRSWEEHQDPFAALREAASPISPGGAKLALDPHCPWNFAQRIRAADRIELVDGGAVSSAMRSVKQPDELALIEASNRITLNAIRYAFRHLRPGMVGSEIAGLVTEAQRAQGGTNPWVLALVGPAAAFPHGTKEEVPLEDGHCVLVDAGCQVHGYWSDLTRTIFYGAASRQHLSVWEAVSRAQKAAFAAIRPGIAAEDIDRAARLALGEAGYKTDYQQMTHRLGHGLGLDVHEDPYFVRGNQNTLEVGNTLSDEPGIYTEGQLGVRLEDIVVVTSEGARWLSTPQTGPTLEGV